MAKEHAELKDEFIEIKNRFENDYNVADKGYRQSLDFYIDIRKDFNKLIRIIEELSPSLGETYFGC